jgi:hypothetical protein
MGNLGTDMPVVQIRRSNTASGSLRFLAPTAHQVSGDQTG